MPRGTCWRGYEQKGFKKKGSRSVPNCVRAGKADGGTLRDKNYLEELWESNKAPWKVWK